MINIFITIFFVCCLFLILLLPKREEDENITYKQLLQRQEWQNKRLKILKRDNYQCVYCGSKHHLQIHHKYYSIYPNGDKVAPWNYPDDALITLCDECHKRTHKQKIIKTYYRRYSDNY